MMQHHRNITSCNKQQRVEEDDDDEDEDVDDDTEDDDGNKNIFRQQVLGHVNNRSADTPAHTEIGRHYCC